MNRQLDASASSLLEAALAARGIRVRTGCDPKRLLGDTSVSAVAVEEGGAPRTLPADLVVFATGITPNRELAQTAGLDCGAGVRVDSALRTSDPHVYAWAVYVQGNTYGLVAPVPDRPTCWPGCSRANALSRSSRSPASRSAARHPQHGAGGGGGR